MTSGERRTESEPPPNVSRSIVNKALHGNAKRQAAATPAPGEKTTITVSNGQTWDIVFKQTTVSMGPNQETKKPATITTSTNGAMTTLEALVLTDGLIW